MNQKIKFSGLTCEACQKLISRRVSKIDGVENVSVEPNGEAVIVGVREISESEILKTLEGTNYKISK